MCGIVGYVGARPAAPILVEGLRRLEYRGYDSAGVAYLGGGRVVLRRGQGRLDAVAPSMLAAGEGARAGIAHTRWATHGRPSDENAHPHPDCSGRVAVVHNGIIENHRHLRERLTAAGHVIRSQTDTEVLSHLVEEQLAAGANLRDAVRGALAQARGSWAVAVVTATQPERIVAARGGSPLVVGVAEHGMLVASDVPALLPFTAEQLVLRDGEGVELTPTGASLFAVDTGATISRTPERVPWSLEQAERGGHPHFMLKEIYEQPRAVVETLAGRLEECGARIPELGLEGDAVRSFDRVELVACGTSWHAAMVGARLLREFAGLPASAEIASEHRFGVHHGADRTLVVAVSQSGETADTLAAVRTARERSSRTLGICNVVGSSLARECDGVLTTRAGPEISVASTKAFATQLAALALLALQLGRARGALGGARAEGFAEELARLGERIEAALVSAREAIQAAVRVFEGAKSALFLGRGYGYPLALEGALKLKEISYVHAEGYPAGEMKHGPIALIDAGLPVVGIVPSGPLRDKVLGNLEEVRAREGRLVVVCPEGDAEARALAEVAIEVPHGPDFATAAAVVAPLQLLAYQVAVARGRDVDKPRNLAKSVTVE